MKSFKFFEESKSCKIEKSPADIGQIKEMIDAVMAKPNLEKIELDVVKLGGREGLQYFAEKLLSHKTITELKCSFWDEAGSDIADMLVTIIKGTTQLHTLILGPNRKLCLNGIEKVIAALNANKSLHTMTFGLLSRTSKKVIDIIGRALSQCSLKSLWISYGDDGILDDDFLNIVQMALTNENITKLELCPRGFYQGTLERLVDMLQKNTTLTTCALYSCGSGEKALATYKDIEKLMDRNRNLSVRQAFPNDADAQKAFLLNYFTSRKFDISKSAVLSHTDVFFLENCAKENLDDGEFMVQLFTITPATIEFASDRLGNDPKYVLRLIAIHPGYHCLVMDWANPIHKDSEEFIFRVYKMCPGAYLSATDRILLDKDNRILQDMKQLPGQEFDDCHFLLENANRSNPLADEWFRRHIQSRAMSK